MSATGGKPPLPRGYFPLASEVCIDAVSLRAAIRVLALHIGGPRIASLRRLEVWKTATRRRVDNLPPTCPFPRVLVAHKTGRKNKACERGEYHKGLSHTAYRSRFRSGVNVAQLKVRLGSGAPLAH